MILDHVEITVFKFHLVLRVIEKKKKPQPNQIHGFIDITA